MSDRVTLRHLAAALGDKLQLSWVCGEKLACSPIIGTFPGTADQSLIGGLNLIHPNRIQVIGHLELIFLADLGSNSFEDTLAQLFAASPCAILVGDDITVDDDLVTAAKSNGVPVLSSPVPDQQLVSEIRYYLTGALAEHVTAHGVFMEVLGVGILITGAPGIGKSELALELITRGHRLVADDAPEFAHVAPGILRGTCPSLLCNFLEVRGLGILNIRALFGDAAIKYEKNLRLIVHLVKMSGEQLAKVDRLEGTHSFRAVLGVDVPQIDVPVAPGRSLAIIVEVAVRNHMLRLKGYRASDDFTERQYRLLRDGTE